MIFFDIDDTLLDHENASRRGAEVFFEHYRSTFQMPIHSFIQLWHQISTIHFQAFLEKKYTFTVQKRLRMKELFAKQNVFLSDEEADQKFYEYMEAYENSWTVFADVVPCLQRLKELGVEIGVISNGDYDQQVKKLKNLGIERFFSIMITASMCHEAKPSKKIFELAAEKANMPIENCYYVGDNLQIDALASRNAGMKGIWLNRKGHKRPTVVTIRSLSELNMCELDFHSLF